VELGYRREILGKRKENELGGAWIQKRNIGKKKKKKS